MGIQTFKKTLTVTAGAYSANDVVGGRIEFKGLLNGTLQSITITDAAAQSVAYLMVFFESGPTDITDNATFTVADADLPKIIYHDTINTGTRVAFTDNSFQALRGLDEPMRGAGGNIFAFLITLGTPTYAATTDVTVILQVETSNKRRGQTVI